MNVPTLPHARLVRIVKPDDERFPHDLLLYPTNDLIPEYWNTVWVRNGIYEQFLNQWDGKTCPACQTPTVKQSHDEKYTGESSNAAYSSTAYYDTFIVYSCINCHCGWTERTGSRSFVEVSYP